MKPTRDPNENRRRYPEAAAFVDAVRKLWPEAKVVRIGPSRFKPGADRADRPTNFLGNISDNMTG